MFKSLHIFTSVITFAELEIVFVAFVAFRPLYRANLNRKNADNLARFGIFCSLHFDFFMFIVNGFWLITKWCISCTCSACECVCTTNTYYDGDRYDIELLRISLLKFNFRFVHLQRPYLFNAPNAFQPLHTHTPHTSWFSQNTQSKCIGMDMKRNDCDLEQFTFWANWAHNHSWSTYDIRCWSDNNSIRPLCHCSVRGVCTKWTLKPVNQWWMRVRIIDHIEKLEVLCWPEHLYEEN